MPASVIQTMFEILTLLGSILWGFHNITSKIDTTLTKVEAFMSESEKRLVRIETDLREHRDRSERNAQEIAVIKSHLKMGT